MRVPLKRCGACKQKLSLARFASEKATRCSKCCRTAGVKGRSLKSDLTNLSPGDTLVLGLVKGLPPLDQHLKECLIFASINDETNVFRIDDSLHKELKQFEMPGYFRVTQNWSEKDGWWWEVERQKASND